VRTQNWLAAIGMLSVVAGMAAWVSAQGPKNEPPRTVYINRTAFKIPLKKIEERDRARLQEVRLYVRQGAGGKWNMAAHAPPTQTEFIYQAPGDGEYWFAVAAVDLSGRMNPSDLSHEAPGIVVIIDQQAPEVTVEPITSESGQHMIRLRAQDPHLDVSKTKLEYLTAEQTWKELKPVGYDPNVFGVPDPGSMRGKVRATAGDLAGNIVTKEIDLDEGQPKAEMARADENKTFANPALPAAESKTPGSPVPPPNSSGARLPAPTAESPAVHASESRTTAPPAPPDAATTRIESQSDKVSAPAVPSLAQTNCQYVAGTHVSIKFELDKSAAQAIEVWMTPDDGQTWQKLTAATQKDNAIDVSLPGEGIFGLCLMGSGPNSSNQAPPKGETPDWRVIVDTTKPEAHLTSVRSGPDGSYDVVWTASDKHLKPEPVDLEFSKGPDGPWMPMATHLKNDGRYHWAPIRPVTGPIYVRMHATDLAGNVTTCQAAEDAAPVRAKPRVVGVTANPGS
jgi:hypothetical protein